MRKALYIYDIYELSLRLNSILIDFMRPRRPELFLIEEMKLWWIADRLANITGYDFQCLKGNYRFQPAAKYLNGSLHMSDELIRFIEPYRLELEEMLMVIIHFEYLWRNPMGTAFIELRSIGDLYIHFE